MKKIFLCLMAITGLLTACSDNNESGRTPTPDGQVISCEPVFRFFKEINGMPRPSMHEEKIRQYLIDFAVAHNLEYTNADGNIIIYKDATYGMQQAPTVVLQTHMDIVCVAADDLPRCRQRHRHEHSACHTREQGGKPRTAGVSLHMERGTGHERRVEISTVENTWNYTFRLLRQISELRKES